MNRREFLKTGIGAVFAALLGWAGVVRAEEPEQVTKHRHEKLCYIDWANGVDKQSYGLSPYTPLATVGCALNLYDVPLGDIVILCPDVTEELESETIHAHFTEEEVVWESRPLKPYRNKGPFVRLDGHKQP